VALDQVVDVTHHRVEELSCEPRTEERHAVAHLERTIAPVLRQAGIAADVG